MPFRPPASSTPLPQNPDSSPAPASSSYRCYSQFFGENISRAGHTAERSAQSSASTSSPFPSKASPASIAATSSPSSPPHFTPSTSFSSATTRSAIPTARSAPCKSPHVPGSLGSRQVFSPQRAGSPHVSTAARNSI